MLGMIMLALALAFALGGALCFAGVRHMEKLSFFGRICIGLSFAGTLLASIYLLVLIFTNRFDIAYVASYSSAELSTMYKISAFWAGQQGSFLLWLLIHAVAAVILQWKSHLSDTGMSVYLAIQALLTILVLAKSPFMPQEVPVSNGIGLNPLLQDPWMAVHPPIIFVGYALLAIPLVYSMTALISEKEAGEWLEPARKWALVAWAFLGAGIFIGGYWAYKVLGWGGFWGWDPVENSSLVPWLVAGVFIHVLKVARVRGSVLSMVHIAAIFAFSLVLYGTFLTRSGILGDFSVHSFSGTSIGLTIALVNALVLLAGLLVLLLRANQLPKGEMYPSYDSREFAVLLGSLVLVFLAAVIFLGMSMPLLTQLAGSPAAVDTDFYVRTTMPLAIVMLLCMVYSCLHFYGKGKKVADWKYIAVFFLLGVALTLYTGVYSPMPLVLAGSAALAAAAAVLAWQKRALSLGGMIAHVGVGVALLAMVLAGNGSQNKSQELVPGEPVDFFGHEVVYQGQEFSEDMREKYYVYTVDGREARALTKLHANGEDAAREPAIDKTIGGDIYIAPTPARDERQELILKNGRMIMDDEFGYRYEGVDMEYLEDGKRLVTATVGVTDGETVKHFKPTILATMEGGTSQPIEVFDGARRIRLTGVSGDEKQIRLEILPSLEEETSRSITANVSTKPFIWILWLGSVLTVCGTFVAVKK